MGKETKQNNNASVKTNKNLKPAKSVVENNADISLKDVLNENETKKTRKSKDEKVLEKTTDLKTEDENKNKSASLKNKHEKDAPQNRILTKEEAEKLGAIKKTKKDKKKKSKPEPKRFDPIVSKGLTDEQVNERVLEGNTNYVENRNTKTYKSIFFGNIFTFFNLLCFVVAGALIAVNAWSNLVFMLVILANMVIGIVQEIKAKKTIEKISLVTAPTAVVVRNGAQVDIPVSDIVLDDVILFTLGKQICADCIVMEGEVEVNESLLTGESNPIKKRKGDVLLSGSFVVSGKCFAKADKIGSSSYTAQLAVKAKEYKKAKSELLNSLNLIIKIIGIIIIPLAILTFYNNFNQVDATINSTIKKTAGSVIGMIPAGMFLLTSLALAVGVIKLAKKRTLVQDLYSIEMLARTDVLCLDKTGTITDGTMKVNSVIQLNSSLDNTINEIVGSMLTALDDNNQTSRALATYFGYSKELSAKEILPFSSKRKLSAVTFKNNQTFAFGAPEFILKTKNVEIEKLVKQYASKGFRVLLLAKCEGGIVKDNISNKVTPVALIVIEDRIREHAAETIEWFKQNGVAIKIISGDNPLTVSEVSKRVGVENAGNYISLEGLSEQQVIDAAEKYSVFGRVSPEQKFILVKALKSKGHKVAMTGDGVNDILALKEADCSIAMASGSEATRNVSHLVLLDSNFNSMPSVVAEGRRVVNNIQKSSSLYLMKTLFTIMITILCLIFSIKYPFSTNQILLLEWCVIGFPSFCLALQPNTEKIKGRFLVNLIAKSLPGALIFVVNVVACYIFTQFTGCADQFATMGSLVLTFSGLLVLYNVCKPIDVFRGILVAAMIVMSVLMIILIPGSFFEYVELSLQNILFIIILIQLAASLYSSVVRLCNKISEER